MIDLAQHAPQQIFLLQGNKQDFQELVDQYAKEGTLAAMLEAPRFTVEHAQELVEFNLQENGTDRWYVVYFPVFSPDAAQALLKTFEEPGVGIHIVLVTPYPYMVPLTIRSRVGLLVADSVKTAAATLTKKDAEDFIKNVLGDDDIDAATKRAGAASVLDMFEAMTRGNTKKANAIYKAKELLFKANLPTKQVVEYAVSVVW